MRINIRWERIRHSGMLVLEATVNGEYYKMRYVDYPLHIAKQSFVEYITRDQSRSNSSNQTKEDSHR